MMETTAMMLGASGLHKADSRKILRSRSLSMMITSTCGRPTTLSALNGHEISGDGWINKHGEVSIRKHEAVRIHRHRSH